jgi:hypothetical protein
MNRPVDILRAQAVLCLENERTCGLTQGTARWDTRSTLFDLAVSLGFCPKTEASTRVDEALTAAGTTP